ASSALHAFRLLDDHLLDAALPIAAFESELDYDEGRNSAISYVSAEWYAYRTVGPDCVELSSPTAWSSTHIRKTGRWIGTEHSSVPLGMLGPDATGRYRLNWDFERGECP